MVEPSSAMEAATVVVVVVGRERGFLVARGEVVAFSSELLELVRAVCSIDSTQTC